jgi:hypothetical protein
MLICAGPICPIILHLITSSLLRLTVGPGRLLPSDLAPILHCGSGPFSHFLANVVGVDTQLFLHITQFNFKFYTLHVIKGTSNNISTLAQLVVCFCLYLHLISLFRLICFRE